MKLEDLILICFFSFNLSIFYFEVLPSIGDHVTEVCHKHWNCRRYLINQEFDFGGFSFSYSIDNGDNQWRSFRSSLRLMSAVIIGFLIVKNLFIRSFRSYLSSSYIENNMRLIFSLVYLFVLHQRHAIVILSVVLIGYLFVIFFKSSKQFSLVIWSYAILVLLLKESYRLMPYYRAPLLHLLHDNVTGLYHWKYPLNFLALRFLSYAIDCRNCGKLEIKNDEKNSFGFHSIGSYLNYMLYSPLYIAGPIMCYRHFHSSSLTSSSPIQKSNIWYGCRLIGAFVLMEYMMNKYSAFAVVSSGLFAKLNVYNMAGMAYLTLKMMWLKFLLMWRWFRWWSMLDGIVPPENMKKCMSNNYSIEGFWKGWHSSFNRWIVEYLYIPLGGASMRYLSVWIIFFFVAFWHDIEGKLFMWGALNSIFYVVELGFSKFVFSRLQQSKMLSEMMLYHLSALGSAFYIYILIGVNLIGYAMGLAGVTSIASKLLTWKGGQVFLGSFYFMWIGVHIMKFIQRISLSKNE